MKLWFAAAVLAALTLSGCMTAAPLEYDVQLKQYVRCLDRSARQIAGQPGDPVSLAYGARGLCASAENELQQHLLTQTSPSQAMSLMRVFRQAALEGATADIVRARAGR